MDKINRYCYGLINCANKSTLAFITDLKNRFIVDNSFGVYRMGQTLFIYCDLSPEKEYISALNDLRSDYGLAGPLAKIFKKPTGIVNYSEIKRQVLTLELKNDAELLKEYIDIHQPEKIWPQIIKNMDEIGVVDMEIYLQGYQAYMIMDTTMNFDASRDAYIWSNMPKEKEWQAFVSRFQKTSTNSTAAEKWKAMEKIQ